MKIHLPISERPSDELAPVEFALPRKHPTLGNLDLPPRIAANGRRGQYTAEPLLADDHAIYYGAFVQAAETSLDVVGPTPRFAFRDVSDRADLKSLQVSVVLATGETIDLPLLRTRSLLPGCPVRADLVQVFGDPERGIYAHVYAYLWDGQPGFKVQLDVGFTRPGHGPWTLEIAEVHWKFTFDREVSTRPSKLLFDTRTPLERGLYEVDLTWYGREIGHGQFAPFEAVLWNAEAVDGEFEWCRYGIYDSWANGEPHNRFLSCLRMPAIDPTDARLSGARALAEARAVSDVWQQRALEGNVYSAAPGGGWANMGRCFYAPLLRGLDPAHITTLRDAAEGLTLMRTHNVLERDGKVVRFAAHPTLRTNRQVVHASSKDMLCAGEPHTERGAGNRNARDLQHYEIGPALALVGTVVDHQVRRSLESMMEMDYATTYIHNGWMQSPRGIGRPMAAWCDLALLFPAHRQNLGNCCAAMVEAMLESWLGKDHLFAAQAAGGRFLATKVHSRINGIDMVAPYEEALAAIGLAKFARQFNDLPQALLARSLAYLLSRSVVQCYREGSVPYLVAHEGGGKAPDPKLDKTGSDYAHQCMGAVIEFLRLGAALGGDADLHAAARALVESFEIEAKHCGDFRFIHWGSV